MCTAGRALHLLCAVLDRYPIIKASGNTHLQVANYARDIMSIKALRYEFREFVHDVVDKNVLDRIFA